MKTRSFGSRPLCRSLVLTAIIVAISALGAPAFAAHVATVGQKAPPYLLETLAGDDLSSRAFAKRPVVLNVFASWCPPCREELPRIAEAARAQRGRIAFVGVDEQEASQIAGRFVRDMRLPYPIALDQGQFAASFGVVSLPVTVFIDRHGIVRAIQHGAIDAGTLQADLALLSDVKKAP